MPRYYVRTAAGTRGPIPGNEVHALIVSRALQESDLIKREGDRYWHPVSSVRGLHAGGAAPVPSAEQAPAALPATTPVTAETGSSASPGGSVSTSRPSKARPGLVLIVGVSILSSLVTGLVVGVASSPREAAQALSSRPSSDMTAPSHSLPKPGGSAADTQEVRQRDADRTFSSATSALSAERFVESEGLFFQLHQANPDDVRYLVGLGRSRAGRGDASGAAIAFRDAIRVDREHADAWSGLGNALAQQDEMKLAVQAWERAAALAPSRVEFSFRLMLVYAATGLWERALPLAERVVGEVGGAPPTGIEAAQRELGLRVLGDGYLSVGRESDARRVFEEVLSHDPSNDFAILVLGRVAARQGRTIDAKSLLGRIQSKSAEASFELAGVAIAERDLDGAARFMEQALRMDGASGDRWLSFAVIQFGRGDISSAMAAADQALSRDSRSHSIRMMRARALLRLNRFEEALSEIEQADTLGAKRSEVLELRGLALHGLRRHDEAEPVLRRAFELGSSLEGAIALVEILNEREAWLESASVLMKLADVDSGNADKWRELCGDMYRMEAVRRDERGDMDGAISHYKLAMDVNPSNGNKAILVASLSLKALRLMASGEYSPARAVVREILPFDSAEASRLGKLIADGERVQAAPSFPVQQAAPAPSGDFFESHIVSDFDGFEHGNLYEFSNGQIWKQTDFHISIRIRVHPRVYVFREGSGWMMKVDGVDRSVRVERIR